MHVVFLAVGAVWLSVPSAPVVDAAKADQLQRAAGGTSWFATTVTNAAEVASARWTTAGLGVYEVYVNGARVGTDFLKPGFTHFAKTKLSFSYDVTPLLKTAARPNARGGIRYGLVFRATDDQEIGFQLPNPDYRPCPQQLEVDSQFITLGEEVR